MTDVLKIEHQQRQNRKSQSIFLSNAISALVLTVGLFLLLNLSRADLLSLFGLDFITASRTQFGPDKSAVFLANLLSAVAVGTLVFALLQVRARAAIDAA